MWTTPGAGWTRRAGAAVGLIVAAPLTALPSCDDYAGPRTMDFVTAAEVVGQNAQVNTRGERLPVGQGDGPEVLEIEGEATVINGGSQLVTLSASEEFTVVLVGIQAVAGAVFTNEEVPEPGPIPGHYEIELAQPATEVELVLTLAQQLPADLFRFEYALANASGQQGPIVSQEATTIVVGAGEVQVSVTWDAASDVDLYVVDPQGTEIFWGATQAPSGGQLDLDSNAGCQIDNVNNENITFADAPPGTYTVRVNYWDSCGVDATRYVVTVRVGGQDPQVINGEFTGDGNRGDYGAGEEITSFTVDG